MSKTIFIAGCDGKTGRAVSELFASSGWNVIGADIKNSTDAKVDQFISLDVTDAEAVAKAADEIDQQTPVTAVLNAAGYEIAKGFEETSDEEWSQLLDTILGGSGNLCKAFAPKMAARKDGKIILISSDYSKEGGDHVIDATAANTLHGFGKSFGVEMAPENVLVNVLFVNTPFDLEKVAETVLFLADKDTYTSAQVVSITGMDQ
ncbi:MAG: SDR family oxidoreductase [Bacillota bacterium]|nr:SDR family oxidoreductase [Bacillota bacterium]